MHISSREISRLKGCETGNESTAPFINGEQRGKDRSGGEKQGSRLLEKRENIRQPSSMVRGKQVKLQVHARIIFGTRLEFQFQIERVGAIRRGQGAQRISFH